VEVVDLVNIDELFSGFSNLLNKDVICLALPILAPLYYFVKIILALYVDYFITFNLIIPLANMAINLTKKD